MYNNIVGNNMTLIIIILIILYDSFIIGCVIVQWCVGFVLIQQLFALPKCT